MGLLFDAVLRGSWRGWHRLAMQLLCGAFACWLLGRRVLCSPGLSLALQLTGRSITQLFFGGSFVIYLSGSLDDVVGVFQHIDGLALPRDGRRNWRNPSFLLICASLGQYRRLLLNMPVSGCFRKPLLSWLLFLGSEIVGLFFLNEHKFFSRSRPHI